MNSATGRPSWHPSENADGVASRILLQTPTHVSQMWTLGPPSSFATSESFFPQNEQLSLRRLDVSVITSLCRVKNTLTI